MTTIETRMVGFNYVEFIARPIFDEFSRPREDGDTVMASLLDLNGDLLAARRRLVFVADTEPLRKTKDLQDGQCMRVLGMPRLNLKLVWWRTTQGRPAPATGVPYEMVVLGVLSDFTQMRVSEELRQSKATHGCLTPRATHPARSPCTRVQRCQTRSASNS